MGGSVLPSPHHRVIAALCSTSADAACDDGIRLAPSGDELLAILRECSDYRRRFTEHTRALAWAGALLGEQSERRTLLTLYLQHSQTACGILEIETGDADDELYIVLLAVARAFRQKGIAAATLRKLKDVARGVGIRELRLGVEASNFGARQAWEKLGFCTDALSAQERSLGERTSIIDTRIIDMVCVLPSSGRV